MDPEAVAKKIIRKHVSPFWRADVELLVNLEKLEVDIAEALKQAATRSP